MEFPNFGFERERIMEYCSSLGGYEEEIEYLEAVKTDYECNPPELDPNERKAVGLVSFLQKQITYRYGALERWKADINDDKIDFVKITGDMIDIARIFEAMKKTKIISINIKTPQLMKIFFTDDDEITRQAKTYNARRSELNKLLPNSNSEQLRDFICYLIASSFEDKEDFLTHIKEHITKVKNRTV